MSLEKYLWAGTLLKKIDHLTNAVGRNLCPHFYVMQLMTVFLVNRQFRKLFPKFLGIASWQTWRPSPLLSITVHRVITPRTNARKFNSDRSTAPPFGGLLSFEKKTRQQRSRMVDFEFEYDVRARPGGVHCQSVARANGAGDNNDHGRVQSARCSYKAKRNFEAGGGVSGIGSITIKYINIKTVPTYRICRSPV